MGTISYDVELLQRDMAARGWIARDLARKAEVSDMSVHRFIDGAPQTARMAKKLARALGFSVRRYILNSQARVDTPAVAQPVTDEERRTAERRDRDRRRPYDRRGGEA